MEHINHLFSADGADWVNKNYVGAEDKPNEILQSI